MSTKGQLSTGFLSEVEELNLLTNHHLYHIILTFVI